MAQVLITLKDNVDDKEIQQYVGKFEKKGWKYLGIEFGFRNDKVHVFEVKHDVKRDGISFSGSKSSVIKRVSIYYDC